MRSSVCAALLVTSSQVTCIDPPARGFDRARRAADPASTRDAARGAGTRRPRPRTADRGHARSSRYPAERVLRDRTPAVRSCAAAAPASPPASTPSAGPPMPRARAAARDARSAACAFERTTDRGGRREPHAPRRFDARFPALRRRETRAQSTSVRARRRARNPVDDAPVRTDRRRDVTTMSMRPRPTRACASTVRCRSSVRIPSRCKSAPADSWEAPRRATTWRLSPFGRARARCRRLGTPTEKRFPVSRSRSAARFVGRRGPRRELRSSHNAVLLLADAEFRVHWPFSLCMRG